MPGDRVERCKFVLLVCFDVLALTVAWHSTLNARLLFNAWLSVQFTREALLHVAPSYSMLLVMWFGAALWLGVYSHKAGCRIWRSVGSALQATFIVGCLIVTRMLVIRNLGIDESRFFVVTLVLLSAVTLVLGRCAASITIGSITRKWGITERVAMMGGIKDAVATYQAIIKSPGAARLQLAGIILPINHDKDEDAHSVPILGSTSRLAEVINCEHLDRIIVVPENVPESELATCSQTSRRMGVTMSRVIAPAEPDARVEFSLLPGLRVLDLRPVYFTRTQEIIKRVFDIVVAAATLLALAPLLILLAVLVKATAPGPVLYTSWRVGRGGRHFRFYKFRSMYDAAETQRQHLSARNQHDGHLFKIRDDPRVTPVGRFMRRFSMDELPQLFNVLLGDMSLVGPRPLPSGDLAPDGQSTVFAAWAEQRSRVLPGITGLWQIRGRSELSFRQMMEFDIAYIRSWSLKLDMEIILRTPLVVLLGRGAY